MKKKIIAFIAAVALSCMFAPSAFAASFDHGGWSYTDKVVSSKIAPHEFVEVSASGKNLIVKGETTIPITQLSFTAQVVKENAAQKNRANGLWIGYVTPKDRGSYYSFEKTIDITDLPNSPNRPVDKLYPDQNYVLYIGYDGGKTFYKNANFNVDEKRNVHIIEWDKVIAKNQAMHNTGVAPEKYLDVSMSDLKKQTGTSLNSTQVSYVKRVAGTIVGSSSNDIDKARKIHDYIAKNFYYDDLAFKEGENQYYDPFETLYNQRNKSNAPNSKNGKVATVCLGKAGMAVMLARAEGIPARLCNGHHVGLGTPYKNWNNEPNVDAIDHWWAEFYINGDWYVVDPDAGSGNHWERRTFSSAGTWVYKGLTGRPTFLPTLEQFSTTYVTYNVFGGTSSSSSSGSSSSSVTPKAPSPKASNVASTGKIRVTWNKASGAAKYEVWRSKTGKTGSFSRIFTTTGTSMTNTSATAGQSYYYKLRAISKTGKASSYSAVVKRACDYAQPKAKIANISSSGKPRVTWGGVTNAKKYEVWRSTTGKTGSFVKVFTTTGKAMTHASATPGKLYYYKVRAVGNSGCSSAYSTAVKRVCDYAQPTVKIANIASTGKVRLTWTACSGASKYQVYYATSKNGAYKQLISTSGRACSHNSGVAGKTYYYKVRAVGSKSDATGAFTAVKSRTCDYAQPKVTVTSTSKGKPRLTWTSCANAKKYQVYYSTSKSGTYRQLISTSGKAVNHNSAVKGKRYYYKVRAVGNVSSACGAFTPVVSKVSK